MWFSVPRKPHDMHFVEALVLFPMANKTLVSFSQNGNPACVLLELFQHQQLQRYKGIWGFQPIMFMF